MKNLTIDEKIQRFYVENNTDVLSIVNHFEQQIDLQNEAIGALKAEKLELELAPFLEKINDYENESFKEYTDINSDINDCYIDMLPDSFTYTGNDLILRGIENTVTLTDTQKNYLKNNLDSFIEAICFDPETFLNFHCYSYYQPDNTVIGLGPIGEIELDYSHIIEDASETQKEAIQNELGDVLYLDLSSYAFCGSLKSNSVIEWIAEQSE